MTKLGPHSKHWNIHGTVRALLERSSPFLIDKKSVEYLIGKISRSADNIKFDFVMDDDISVDQITERGLNLLLVCIYITLFFYFRLNVTNI